MYAAFVVIQPDAVPPPNAKPKVYRAMSLFIVALGVGLVLLVVAVMVFRRQHYRLAKAREMQEELSQIKAKKKPKADPWVEAGRRMDPGQSTPAESDTVDFDPRELSPEDIQPPDDTPPQNGHGNHGGPSAGGGNGGKGGGGGGGGPGGGGRK